MTAPVPRPQADPASSLTPRQEAFARHYAASGNGAAAARAAGYAPDSAKQTAHDLLQSPVIRDRIAALEDAHGRTLRGEVGVMLDRLDAAYDLASRAGDYRAMLDIARLQAQVAALTGPEAGRRRALLYDRIGGPGPLARSRAGLDPHATIDPDAYAAEVAARIAAEIAADEAEAARLARTAAGRDPEHERAASAAAPAAPEAGPCGADPDLSLPPAGMPPIALSQRPQPSARAALLASAAAVRAPEGVALAA